MNEHRAIMAPLDDETRALIDRVASRRGVTSEQYAADAIRRVAESDSDFDAFIQQGVDAIDRGDVIPHEEVMAKLGAMIAAHRARCG